MTTQLLIPSAFLGLPLGAIKPEGWLRNQLRIQGDGLTGHLEEHWKDVGSDTGWLGGSGESWERGPYYLDGLLPLGYLLEDDALIEKAQKWVEWTFSSQKDDGSFGPNHLTTVNAEIHDHDWWQDVIMLKVLTQYHEVTHDDRVIRFMKKYFEYLMTALKDRPLKEWAEARGQDLLLSIQWLMDRTKDPTLLYLAETVHTQTKNWSHIFSNFSFWRKQEQWDHRTHVVNVAMGIKAPAVFYRQTTDKSDRDAVYQGITSLMTYHGQAHGMFSGDEWLSGTSPSQGVELCAVVEYMFSMENLVRILGDGRFGDILEQVAFNALPAAISPDWHAHQYDQQVNQVMCSVAERPWSNGQDANLFGLEPNFGCCTANMHQGWPKFVSSLWQATHDGGLAAVSYAPCTVRAQVARDVRISLRISGEYPFQDYVSIHLTLSRSAQFPLYLRIPGWCSDPIIKVNGAVQDTHAKNGFVKLRRLWTNSDKIDITLPMSIQLHLRNNEAVSVLRGPIVYVLPIQEQWICVNQREKFHDFEVYPTTSWRYALVANTPIEAEERNVTYQPFQAKEPPVTLTVQGTLISNWGMANNSAADPPLNPKPYSNRTDTLELIPYGCARLRIGEFPVLKN